MHGFRLDERVRLAIELSLTASQDTMLHERQDAQARRLGMTGADIDAARRGRSFEVQTLMALTLATARSGEERRKLRERAIGMGLAEAVCREIERFADDIAARLSP